MQLGKIKPTATIVAQFAAGVEIDAIQHEGKLFLPAIGMGDFVDTPVAGDKPTKKSEPKHEDADEAPKSKATKTYTEDELMEMSTKDLLKMCKEMGIDPDETDGKNTNKKLRTLILEKQKEGDTDSDDDEDADDAPDNDNDDNDGDEDTDELVGKVGDLLEDFDSGKKNRKKTLAALLKLSDADPDEDDITVLLDEFEDDADADLDETAEKIAAVLQGKRPKKAEKKPAKKSKKSKKEDEELVDPSDLEVGDRVSVWWDDDNKDWFEGEVKSISKKGKVTIHYDDDTDDVLDPEVHTKIKRID
jgi:hypothetical protein